MSVQISQYGVVLYRSARLKVPNGKLLEVRIEYDGTIKSIQIIGDFFVYPESGLGDIERALVGTKITNAEVEITKLISEVVGEKDIVMVGVDPESISRAMKMVFSE